MRIGRIGIRNYSNFILFMLFFFSGAGAIVSYLFVGKPQWFANWEPVDLATYGFMTCGAVGLIFFLRSLKRRRV